MINLTQQETEDNIDLEVYSCYGYTLMHEIKAQDLLQWLKENERQEDVDFIVVRKPNKNMFSLSKPVEGKNTEVTLHCECSIPDAAYRKDGKWFIKDAEKALEIMFQSLTPTVTLTGSYDSVNIHASQPVKIKNEQPWLFVFPGVNVTLIKESFDSLQS